MTGRLSILLLAALLSGCAVKDPDAPKQACSDPLGLYTRSAIQPCCIAHDQAYHNGGSERDRLAADTQMYTCIRDRGYPEDAESMFYAVRLFGGSRFRYKERP
jgi:hypothetical protein